MSQGVYSVESDKTPAVGVGGGESYKNALKIAYQSMPPWSSKNMWEAKYSMQSYNGSYKQLLNIMSQNKNKNYLSTFW